MSAPLTEQRLAEIEARIEKTFRFTAPFPLESQTHRDQLNTLALDDVPDLLAEVRRLRQYLTSIAEDCGPADWRNDQLDHLYELSVEALNGGQP